MKTQRMSEELFNSLTTTFFQRKKKCMQKKKIKKNNQCPRRDSNLRSRALEQIVLPTWLLHYIGVLEILAAILTSKDVYGR